MDDPGRSFIFRTKLEARFPHVCVFWLYCCFVLHLQAKQQYDKLHLPEHPLTFLYHYFARLAPSANTTTTPAVTSIDSNPDTLAPATVMAEHSSVVRQAYSLYHACASHGATSPAVQLFSAVLTGHIGEAAWGDRQAMASGLLQVLSALPRAAGCAGESRSMDRDIWANLVGNPGGQGFPDLKSGEAWWTGLGESEMLAALGLGLGLPVMAADATMCYTT